MEKSIKFLVVTFFLFSLSAINSQETKEKSPIDTRIDNMGYWKRMAKEGFVPVEPVRAIPKATIKGSKINAKSVNIDDSPDVPVNDDGDNTQSENSIFVNPTDNSKVLNSNNSTSWSGGSVGSVYGANYFNTADFGITWGGSVQGAGGGNSGDPGTAISLDGLRHYVGFIHSSGGQGVSYSTDGGNVWTSVLAGPTSGFLDKNHLWIDNSPTSAHEGNVYDAWTDFGGSFDNEIGFVRSTDGGLTYSSAINVSSAVNAGSHNQGVNIQTGPSGEVYLAWAIYDSWPSDETAIGFAKSIDGGASFATASRVITNIKGIRTSEVSKNHRVNSFPSMATDISGGPDDGNIYIVWANVGVPGTNTGTNRSVYMAKSTNGGTSWETPVRVNQGTFTAGKEAYFPWITCDPETGVLSVIFYDDRDVASTQVETWVANSYDAGATWEDFRVSDVAFTPQPISGLASSYMGDYLGISARGSMVYPVWPDNRNGYVQTFVSPFETNNRAKPENLNIALTFGTGQTDLTWTYSETKSLQHFVVYRDNVEIGTSLTPDFTDMLPSYGVYQYSVTAMHEDGESSPARNSIQWGDPHISVSPTELIETLQPDQTSVKILTVENTGELDLTYNIETAITTAKNTKAPQAYCTAGGGGDEYISGVVFGTISNTGTGASGYSDYTAMSTDVDAGNTYPITLNIGNPYSSDDWGIWIDWNQDEDFDDVGEEVVCEFEVGNTGTYNYNIDVPSDALGGSTVMRIRLKWSGNDCGSSCGTTTYGEVEDYTVNVNSWLQVGTTSGTVLPGTTEQINVNFDSTDLALGDYFATITINSNDTDQPQVAVPVTLHVTNTSTLQVSASADDYEICSGSSTILHANPSGGTGNYTFSWTSNPAGFTSSDENPSVAPTVNTIYTVSVFDGISTVTSDVSITVIDILGAPDAPTGDTELCQDAVNSTYTTNTVAGASSYEWSIDPTSAGTITGTTTSAEVNWDENFSGIVTIAVSAVNTCGPGTVSNTTVTINELPTVSLSAFDAVCINTLPFMLTGGTPSGGTYTGVGVTNNEFNPASAGIGTHVITYGYADTNGCENFATQTITVHGLPTVTFDPLASVFDYEPAFELTGGAPTGGTYSGVGVSGGFFDPAVAGPGIHTITYTYSDANGCENMAQQTIEVISTIGIDDLSNDISFNIYPNPNNGKLFVDIRALESRDLTISVFNQLGVKMMTQQISVSDSYKTAFDLTQFAQGVYFLSIQGEKLNYVRKIILQK